MCVCVCMLVVMCLDVLVGAGTLWTEEADSATGYIFTYVCVRCLSGIKLYREEILPPAGSPHSRGERHLNSFNTNCQHEKPNVQAKFFHVQYVSKFLTHKILVADMKCWGTDKAPLGKVFLSLLLLIRSEPHTGCFYISHHLMLWAGGKFLSITKLSSFFLSLSKTASLTFIRRSFSATVATSSHPCECSACSASQSTRLGWPESCTSSFTDKQAPLMGTAWAED